MAERRLAIHRD